MSIKSGSKKLTGLHGDNHSTRCIPVTGVGGSKSHEGSPEESTSTGGGLGWPASKLPKSLRRLLDLSRSSSASSSGSPNTSPAHQMSSPTGSSPGSGGPAMIGGIESQEELHRDLPPAPSRSCTSPGGRPGRSSLSPSPKHSKLPPSTSFGSYNHPCSPINHVIVEEEYEDPAEAKSRVAKETEIDTADQSEASDEIYTEPCDLKMKTDLPSENKVATSSDVTGGQDRSTEMTSSDSVDAIGAPLGPRTHVQSATGRSSTASSADSRHTLSESPAVTAANVDCRPKPLANENLATASILLGAPQGNTIISHHPASPFEPLPRLQQPLPPVPASSGEGRALSQTVVSTITPSLLQPVDSQFDPGPTYEEAWDLKMNRLGLDMSRLATDPELESAPISGGHPAPSVAPPAPPLSLIPPVPPHAPNAAINRQISGVVDKETRSHSSREQVIGGLSGQSRGEANSQAEYDYAYNANWSKHVKMNLSLNLKASNGSEDSSGQDRNPPISVGECSVPPPALIGRSKSHSSELAISGPSLGLLRGSTLGPGDTDSLSTDSYDEPWDVRHGRVISELTSSRLIDPSCVLPKSGPTPGLAKTGHNGVPTVTSPPGLPQSAPPPPTPPPHGRPWSRQLSAADAIDKNMPLDEQRWFHHNLTRATAEVILNYHRDGSYLVRRSETGRNDFSLSIKRNGGFLHMKISRNENGMYILGQYSQPYLSVPVMIHHYSRTLLPIKGADSMTLRFPVLR